MTSGPGRPWIQTLQAAKRMLEGPRHGEGLYSSHGGNAGTSVLRLSALHRGPTV